MYSKTRQLKENKRFFYVLFVLDAGNIRAGNIRILLFASAANIICFVQTRLDSMFHMMIMRWGLVMQLSCTYTRTVESGGAPSKEASLQ